METTCDAFLDGAIEILQPAKGGHRAGMDALLLAATVPDDFSGRLADFGAGCGVAGMAVAHRCPAAQVDLVEIDGDMAGLARNGIDLSKNAPLRSRLAVIEADVTADASERRACGLETGTYDRIIANPPFNDLAHRPSPNEKRRLAHELKDGDLKKWVRAASASLGGKGHMTFIIRPQQLNGLLNAMAGRVGSIRIRPVSPKAEAQAKRVLVSGRKGGRAAMAILSPLVVHEQDGTFTKQADAIFKGRTGLSL